MSRLRRDQRGVTIVEAAFVIPVFFLFAFGLIDMGLWTLQRGEATSAARDGARAGIVLDLKNLNTTQINDKVQTAVEAKLIDRQVTSVTVSCIDSTTGNTIACGKNAALDYGRDQIRVSVTWKRPFLTFVGTIFGGNARDITGTSTMVIAGAPT